MVQTVASTEQSLQSPAAPALQVQEPPLHVPPFGAQGVSQSVSVWHSAAVQTDPMQVYTPLEEPHQSTQFWSLEQASAQVCFSKQVCVEESQ